VRLLLNQWRDIAGQCKRNALDSDECRTDARLGAHVELFYDFLLSPSDVVRRAATAASQPRAKHPEVLSKFWRCCPHSHRKRSLDTRPPPFLPPTRLRTSLMPALLTHPSANIPAACTRLRSLPSPRQRRRSFLPLAAAAAELVRAPLSRQQSGCSDTSHDWIDFLCARLVYESPDASLSEIQTIAEECRRERRSVCLSSAAAP
jgi:hypothetical protein